MIEDLLPSSPESLEKLQLFHRLGVQRDVLKIIISEMVLTDDNALLLKSSIFQEITVMGEKISLNKKEKEILSSIIIRTNIPREEWPYLAGIIDNLLK